MVFVSGPTSGSFQRRSYNAGDCHLKPCSYHSGKYIQKGYGWGSLFSSLARKVLPAIAKVGKSVLKSPITKKVLTSAKDAAISGGINVLSDIVGGENIADSLKQNVVNAKQTVSNALRSSLQEHNKTKATTEKKSHKRSSSSNKSCKNKRKNYNNKAKIKNSTKRRRTNNSDIFDA